MTSRTSVSGARDESRVTEHADERQVAALCHRQTENKSIEVLLITSRDTGRWIIPKGWPVKGKTDLKSAMQEAWEEAGVVPRKADEDPIGTYFYDKRLNNGDTLRCETRVFDITVEKLAKDFPEREERRRKWVAPNRAAKMVDEPELRGILKTFAT